jgi:NitT/TauT family transport system permease protein
METASAQLKSDMWRSIAVFIAFLSVWQLLSVTGVAASFFISSPVAVAGELMRYTRDGTLPRHLAQTAIETLVGFTCGIIAGSSIGFLFWYAPSVARILRPYMKAFGAVPVFTLAPLIILWFGVGVGMKIVLSGFAVGLATLAYVYEGAQTVSARDYAVLRLYGASRLKILQVYTLPTALSWVFSSMRTGVGLAVLGAFIGEFVSSSSGLGYFMVKSGSLYNVAAVLAGAVYLIALSLLLHVTIEYLYRHRFQIISKLS